MDYGYHRRDILKIDVYELKYMISSELIDMNTCIKFYHKSLYIQDS